MCKSHNQVASIFVLSKTPLPPSLWADRNSPCRHLNKNERPLKATRLKLQPLTAATKPVEASNQNGKSSKY